MALYTQTELETQIKALDATIRSGVRTVTVDGTSTTIDLDAMKDERARLSRQLIELRRRRPPAARIVLGGG